MESVIQTLVQVVIGLLGLSFLVFIHEMGHFLVAKWGGVRVEVFSIGFGKKLLKFKYGETVYCISAIPFGGYVAMSGEQLHSNEALDEAGQESQEVSDSSESSDEVFTPSSTGYNSGDFASKPIWLRAAIAFGGPFVNIVFAFFVLLCLYMYGVPEYDQQKLIVGSVMKGLPGEQAGVLPKDTILYIDGEKTRGWNEFLETMAMSDGEARQLTILRGQDTLIKPVTPVILPETEEWGMAFTGINSSNKVFIARWLDYSPAKSSGMQLGDQIVSINGTPLVSGADLNMWVGKSQGKTLQFLVKHPDGQEETIALAPKQFTPEQIPTLKKTRWLMGIQPIEKPMDPPSIHSYGLFEGTAKAWDRGLYMAQKPFVYLYKMITGKISAKSMSGPVAIVGMIGWSFHAGVQKLIEFLALISMNLGIMNLLPLAVTDGGILVFLGIEAIRGKPISSRLQLKINTIAMYFFLGFFLFVMYNDVLRIPMLFGN